MLRGLQLRLPAARHCHSPSCTAGISHGHHLRAPDGAPLPSTACSLGRAGYGRRRPAASSLPELDLELPELEEDLRTVQAAAGAIFEEGSDAPVSFRNSEAVAGAQEQGCALADLTHGWGRLRVTGRDALSFLHQQSTADFKALQPGQGCRTVFLTAQGRALALATCYVLSPQSVMLTAPAEACNLLSSHLQKYILYGDQVEVKDAARQCSHFVLVGQGAEGLLHSMGAQLPLLDLGASSAAELACAMQQYQSGPLLLAQGSGLGAQPARQGCTLIADDSVAAELWQTLVTQGAVPMGSADWEVQRVAAGVPGFGAELTGEYIPFEAGLWSAVCLSKGCYMGQETLAKVFNLRAHKRRLAGLALSAPAAVGTPVMLGSKVLGAITSTAETHQGAHIALAYLRSRQGRVDGDVQLEGLQVTVQGSLARVTSLAYATWELKPGSMPAQKAAAAVEQTPSLGTIESAAEQALEVEDPKAAKLREMEARVKAWQQQQQQQASQ